MPDSQVWMLVALVLVVLLDLFTVAVRSALLTANLVRLLAFQIGRKVSLTELGGQFRHFSGTNQQYPFALQFPKNLSCQFQLERPAPHR